ncbi:MAG: hypothetical protein JXA20_14135 [Spirochaetes bacterium]|nr:hypothetical protein [Spirochaetota bacterium]
MNKKREQSAGAFQGKIAFIVIAVHLLSLAVLISLMGILKSDDAAAPLDTAIANLEKSVSMEKAITDSVVQLSGLARKSGYELAVDEVIGDHRRIMGEVRRNLTVLKETRTRNDDSPMKIAVIAVMVIQGSLLAFILYLLFRRVTVPIQVMSQHIDDIMAGKKPDIWDMKRIVVFRDFYYRFAGLLKLMESEPGPNRGANKDRSGKTSTTRHKK